MEHEIKKLDVMADWMDSRFTIPGTSIRFGLDSIIGLVPIVGDSVTFLTTAYLLGKAHSLKLPWHVKVRIFWNGFIDWLIGLIPLIGDILDIRWKANKRNVQLIKKYLS